MSRPRPGGEPGRRDGIPGPGRGRLTPPYPPGPAGNPAGPLSLTCLACGQPPRRDDIMSWWACPCRVWVTDEDLARQEAR